MSVTGIRTAVSTALKTGATPNYITGDEMKAILGKSQKQLLGWSDKFVAADGAELKALFETSRLTFRGDDFEGNLAKPTLSYAATLHLWKALENAGMEVKNRPIVRQGL